MSGRTIRIVALLIMALLALTGLPGPIPRVAAQCGGPITAGQTVTGTIARAGNTCRYTFTGAASEAVTITMTATSPALDPYLQLLDPNQRVIASDDDSAGGVNSRISYTLRQAGAYTISAESFNNASAGSFNLRLESSAGSGCGGPIPANTWVGGNIARNGQRCQYTFSGAAGETVSVMMRTNSRTLDPWLDLADPRGAVVAFDDDSYGVPNSQIKAYQLRLTGQFTIVARAYNDASAGPFEVFLERAYGGPIPANTWVSGTISVNGQRCEYTFSGTAGEVVSIAMRATSRTLDPWLDLKDPSGNVVTYDDDSYGGSDSQIKDYRLRQTGPYTIVARAYNDASYGAFEVYLERRR